MRLLAAVGVLSLAPLILPRVELSTTQAFGFGWVCACLVVFGRKTARRS